MPVLVTMGGILGCLLGTQMGPVMALAAVEGGRTSPPSPDVTQLVAMIEKLRPLHKKLGKPQLGDWLSVHHESGQTFQEYIRSRPITPRGERHVIYIFPLGEFTTTQRKIITLTAEFMSAYFNLPARVEKDLPLSLIPAKARRRHPSWGMEQILTTYVLDEILRPRLPADAAVALALTTSDLWPGEGWNFVFGQASLRDRVGVWSLYRNGDPDKDDESFRLCLLRTLKTATHETGHMFSMQHCIAYECDMCGSNHRAESDRRPLWLCPECMAKVCYATGADPIARYERLAAFCKANAFKTEDDFYRKSLERLERISKR